MYSVRTVRTGSGATAVQVVRYAQRKRVVVKHIGSAHRPEELASLTQTAHTWIEKQSGQTALFPPEKPRAGTLIPVDKCRYLGFRYALAYETIHQVFRSLHLDGLPLLLRDLALIRIVQPASQLESLDLLSTYFGKTYRSADLYRRLPSFVAAQGEVERHLCRLARAQFHFDFSIVFYDVTTLFFESFKEDEFRRIGFSKDHKLNQPQIVIGLIVTREGFPIAYEVFEGNRFEGHTFIPVLRQLKETHDLDHFTVVADAAMISLDNITQLAENRLSYIVGARLANLAVGQIKAISESLKQTDQATLRLHTERGDLICDFSQRRHQKDKREMEKQIAKAEKLLGQGQTVKRTKFIKYPSKTKPTLNRALIEKTRLLLGVKGYYTDLTSADNQTIIEQYHNLWHVEQAFRISKSDLAIRPIYHFKQPAIEAHVLICFIALAACKYLELKTGQSTRQITKLLKSVTDGRLRNLLTGEEIILRSEPTTEVNQLLQTLWH